MYQHGKRVQRPHNYKIFLATVAVIGVVVLGAWFLIHKDIANTTKPKSNIPIVSNIGASDESNNITIQEPYFTFSLPSDWKLKTEVHATYANFYQWVSTKKGGDDRTLIAHVDTMPQDYKIVKMQPLTPNGSSFLLGTLSDDCVNFSGGVEHKDNAAFQAKWQDVLFMCDPISVNQTIGTGSKANGIGVPLSGSKGTHKYFFYYEDHNIRPDSTIFRDALSSFKAL